MKNKSASPSGIVLYAKKSGLTSFSSLWSIKHSLGTQKVGHTGTLDSFADGLLVVLTGHLTHIVPHITGFTKTYYAVVCFGRETDTLDPTGKIIEEGNAVTKNQLQEKLKDFTGALLQTPPLYSAVHVNGKRASDVARSGKEVQIEPRQIFVYENELIDFKETDEKNKCSYALLKIKCSKGTYIRSLARDIARSLGSCGYLIALRRTQVGPFNLEDAALADELDEFTIQNAILKEPLLRAEEKNEKKRESDSIEKILSIKNAFMPISQTLAEKCGFYVDELKPAFEKSFLNGRPLMLKMFDCITEQKKTNEGAFSKKEIAVFYKNGNFAGMIKVNEDDRLCYNFVVPPQEKDFQVYKWNEFVYGNFSVDLFKKGIAVTVGSFESLHLGHKKIMETLKQTGYSSGVVTFAKNIKGFEQELYSLDQRLSLIKDLGMDFAIVIDFDDEFKSIDGRDFIATLSKFGNVKKMIEGKDFKFGNKGSCSMRDLSLFSNEFNFAALECDDIKYLGEKISSSRVRKNIECGSFDSVNELLGRSWSYSADKLFWNQKDDWFYADAVSSQILPKSGEYKVLLKMNDGSNLHTDVRIEDKKIFCLIPSLAFAKKITEIVFI